MTTTKEKHLATSVADEHTTIRWGKYKGKTLDEAAQDPRFTSYCDWVIQQSEGKGDKQGFLNDALAWKAYLAKGDETTEAEESSEDKQTANEKSKPHPEHRRVA